MKLVRVLVAAAAGFVTLALEGRASDKVWDKAVCKGAGFLEAMKSSDAAAATLFGDGRTTAASQFQDIEKDLPYWGWTPSHEPFSNLIDLEIPEAVEALSWKFKQMKYYEIEHDKDYEHNGQKYKHTRAEMEFGVETSGTIFAFTQKSPANAARTFWRRKPEENELPELQSSSDLIWFAIKDAKLANLGHYMSCLVTNQETRDIMQRALQSKGVEVGEWPGYSFEMTSDEGQALLGSPNGVGLGYLLVQRKKELGNKCVTKATVFRPKDNSNPMLLLEIADCAVENC
ncbi:hypothetical protein BDV95DRAFT_600711 [Massariosphaeria phaeospora]|uniref:Uncharacterized protein n=1 Tax=Massariosphaeria phaeospora TaxID=100035 RepID=A0A7C8IJM7_9PLEO|nr:hypothetical protein BDV95DRAFT_600711 [Massariosphaeria phaeospora]